MSILALVFALTLIFIA